MNLQELEKEVARRADEMTPELLPQLLERFLSRDSLVSCERHSVALYQYIEAQISLTRAKRAYFRDDTGSGDKAYLQALESRNSMRKIYRSKPCTCWVQHR